MRFRSNCRSGVQPPIATVAVNGGSPISFTASPAVGGNNPYYFVTTNFVATAATASLVIANNNSADSALLVDDFSIGGVPTIPDP